MNLELVSWDALTTFNDGTNYRAYFPRNSVLLPIASRARYVERPFYEPVYTSRDRQAQAFVLKVLMLGTFGTQINTVKQRFNPTDTDRKKLVVKDTANSNKQWYTYCKVTALSAVEGQEVTILLERTSDWYEDTQSTDSWSITATGQTKAITPDGNVDARPIFTITPTSAKALGTGGYWRFVTLYNRTANALTNYPLEITGGGLNTSALVADNSNKCQINQGGGISNSLATIPYDTVTGSLPDAGMGYVDTEQISWTGKTGTTSGDLTGCSRGINGTTAATHADNAEIKVSKMQADGDDIRVLVDGVETPRWLVSMNGASTKIWANFELEVSQTVVLSGALSNIGSIATINVQNTAGAQSVLAGLPSTGLVLIDSELFFYTGRDTNDPNALKFTGTTRAVRGTSAAAHTNGTTIRYIQHEINVTYGSSSLPAPSQDETKKAIFTLSSSSNTSWDYDEFMELFKSRAGAWTVSGLVSSPDVTFNGPAGPYRDEIVNFNQSGQLYIPGPAVALAMGMSAASGNSGVSNMSGGVGTWLIYNPCGFTTYQADGHRAYLSTNASSIPTLSSSFARSADGVSFTNVTSVSNVSVINTDESWTIGSTGLGATYPYFRFQSQPSVLIPGTGHYRRHNVAVYNVTLTLDSNAVPSVTLGSEISGSSGGGGYQLSPKITNTTTGEWLLLSFVMDLNQSIRIDCDAKTVTYLVDNSPVQNAISAFSSSRFDWLNLRAGVSNTLQWDETGVAGVTVDIAWRDRNT